MIVKNEKKEGEVETQRLRKQCYKVFLEIEEVFTESRGLGWQKTWSSEHLPDEGRLL